MDLSPYDLMLGLGFSSLIALAAYYKKSLSLSGLFAAIILGSLIFLLGRWLLWTTLILFFVSSSLLSKYKHQAKLEAEAEFSKTGRRDWLQVLANGAAALGFALAWRFTGNELFSAGCIAAFATVNADTWATEIGVLSRKPPVCILSLKPAAPGMSGAVSLLGTCAAVAGAAFISVSAALGVLIFLPGSINPLPLILAGTAGGVFGCIADSILGATVQTMYRCTLCGKLTEKKVHHNHPAEKVRGLKFFGNDMVNFTSSLLGSLLALAIYHFLT